MLGQGCFSTSRPPSPAPTLLPSWRDDFRHDAEEGQARRAGLRGVRAGQRGQHDRAGLGLPPGVDDRAALLADVLVVPDPRFGVDRLADGAEQAQAREIGLGRPLVARADEGADRRRRRVQDGHLVLLDDLPEAAPIRLVRARLRTSGRSRRSRAARTRCSCGPVTQPTSAVHQ